jgi:hypothetical protein
MRADISIEEKENGIVSRAALLGRFGLVAEGMSYGASRSGA